MAFPRLNALSYWLFVLGGAILMLSFFAHGGAGQSGLDAAIRRSRTHQPGNGMDLWILSLHILSLSSLAGAINFIVTIHNLRTPRDDVDAHAALRVVDRALRRGCSWSIMPVLVRRR